MTGVLPLCSTLMACVLTAGACTTEKRPAASRESGVAAISTSPSPTASARCPGKLPMREGPGALLKLRRTDLSGPAPSVAVARGMQVLVVLPIFSPITIDSVDAHALDPVPDSDFRIARYLVRDGGRLPVSAHDNRGRGYHGVVVASC